MITLKNLRWDNCFSYGEKNILNLSEHTITQIVGTNGVGKSSIPLISLNNYLNGMFVKLLKPCSGKTENN